MVAVLSEWWLFYLSGGWCRPLPTTVGTSLSQAHNKLGTVRARMCVCVRVFADTNCGA